MKGELNKNFFHSEKPGEEKMKFRWNQFNSAKSFFVSISRWCTAMQSENRNKVMNISLATSTSPKLLLISRAGKMFMSFLELARWFMFWQEMIQTHEEKTSTTYSLQVSNDFELSFSTWLAHECFFSLHTHFSFPPHVVIPLSALKLVRCLNCFYLRSRLLRLILGTRLIASSSME